MVSRVCICCGEPIPEQGGADSPNPNLCSACASLEERTDDSEAQLEQKSVPLPQAATEAQLRSAA